ncbi:MAG TPA: radical SAM protein [Firmicutes bacterium]|nr:radical SAM protein [Bacillota bacterium]
MDTKCYLCPRRCGADRSAGEKGFCRAGLSVKVARAAKHHWEEPCISGTRGSGAVFFSHCNLRCVFCQNYDISHQGFGKEIGAKELACIFLRLQADGAHNINLVSPTQYITQVKCALIAAKENGLTIPVVYNSNAYEEPDALASLTDLVDVYLPDLKYYHDEVAIRYSSAPHYFRHATSAILEMARQVGTPILDSDGLIRKGLIVRHLVLPGMVEESKRGLDWIKANLPSGVYISLMSQYVPMYRASEHPEINRKLSKAEYDEVVDYALAIGLDNGYIQEESASDESFIPAFDLTGVE